MSVRVSGSQWIVGKVGTGPKGRARMLTPLQLETRFWGQNYLDLV